MDNICDSQVQITQSKRMSSKFESLMSAILFSTPMEKPFLNSKSEKLNDEAVNLNGASILHGTSIFR